MNGRQNFAVVCRGEAPSWVSRFAGLRMTVHTLKGLLVDWTHAPVRVYTTSRACVLRV